MGIVKTITSGTAVVRFDDGCYAGANREEIARRWAAVDRAAGRMGRECDTSSGPSGHLPLKGKAFGETRGGTESCGTL